MLTIKTNEENVLMLRSKTYETINDADNFDTYKDLYLSEKSMKRGYLKLNK